MVRLLGILSVTRDNLRYAVRRLLRSPGFTAAVVVTLALGIGVNATMFGIVDRLLLSGPAHVKDADQVRRLYAHMRSYLFGGVIYQAPLSYLDFADWQEARSFASVAAYYANEVTLGRGVDAVRLNWGLASASFFRLLGVEPALGRFFDESEDRTGAAAVAVLSYGLWQARFGADPSVLGRTVDIGKGSYTVIPRSRLCWPAFRWSFCSSPARTWRTCCWPGACVAGRRTRSASPWGCRAGDSRASCSPRASC
ncbi:MAG: hypothetical protein AMS25_17465 [Gemmatimonas sp. SM23_52]|nr:MAG: hypothetical protein AMS25_17465 [Gemmatimonas sp. SM23_52]